MGRCAYDTQSHAQCSSHEWSLHKAISAQKVQVACVHEPMHMCRTHALMALSIAGSDMQETQYVCLWHCGTQAQGWLPCSSQVQLQVGLSSLLAPSKLLLEMGKDNRSRAEDWGIASFLCLCICTCCCYCSPSGHVLWKVLGGELGFLFQASAEPRAAPCLIQTIWSPGEMGDETVWEPKKRGKTRPQSLTCAAPEGTGAIEMP